MTKSGNSKIGKDVSATYRGKQSCPKDCALWKACFAKAGYTNLAFERAKKNSEQDSNQIYNFIKSLPIGRKLRHFVSGDICNNNKIDWNFIKAMIRGHEERPDTIGFGYTHSWRRFKQNPFTSNNLTMNGSCEKIHQLALAKKRGFDVVLVVPETVPNGKSVYKGENILVCPSQTSERLVKEGKTKIEVTCSTCMLCARKNRNYTIAFRVHSANKKHFKE